MAVQYGDEGLKRITDRTRGDLEAMSIFALWRSRSFASHAVPLCLFLAV
jgi:hypothetical protein